jgi:hypothetical protein
MFLSIYAGLHHPRMRRRMTRSAAAAIDLVMQRRKQWGKG